MKKAIFFTDGILLAFELITVKAPRERKQVSYVQYEKLQQELKLLKVLLRNIPYAIFLWLPYNASGIGSSIC